MRGFRDPDLHRSICDGKNQSSFKESNDRLMTDNSREELFDRFQVAKRVIKERSMVLQYKL